MRRRALAAAGLLALLGAPARAADDPPPPKVDLARWEASDAEARWVLRTAAGGSDPSWARFLAERGEHALLEWSALATASSDALAALEAAKAPAWVRTAVWNLRSGDSHKVDHARNLLLNTRPGLALDWLERHPSAAKDPVAAAVLRELRQAAPAREDASGTWPPVPDETLLAALSPPADGVVDLGERRAADPGRTYVHQVERALDVLTTSTLRAEPWHGRVRALLRHAHPTVRRRAALAFSYFPPEVVPLADLLARVDDDGETAGVRAAALVGLSYGSGPRAYLALLAYARRPDHPAWQAAMSRLGDVGDGFALLHLAGLDVSPAGADGPEVLARTAKAVRERWARETAEPGALSRSVVPLLSRAAWADLLCRSVEGALIPWTVATLRTHAADPAVAAALRRVLDEDVPGLEGGTDFGLVRDRARRYATEALAR